jgi:hypothetical protein
MQVVAIFAGLLIFSTILHKIYSDVSLLARLHSGAEFWVALARHLIRNLAGGA